MKKNGLKFIERSKNNIIRKNCVKKKINKEIKIIKIN